METLYEEVEAGRALLLDVRTEEEWNEGHAEGARHFDLMRLMHGEAPDVPKEKPIYLYCHSGNRAGMAEAYLKKQGFANTKNIGGLPELEGLKIPLASS